jgi:hypothetical protein
MTRAGLPHSDTLGSQRLTAPPGLSQPPTSFIGPWYQGIHRPPLPTYPHTQTSHTNRRTTEHQKILASTMQISTHHQPTTSNHPTRDSHQPCLAKTTTPEPTPPGRSHDHQAARLFPQNLNRVSTAPPTRTRRVPFPPPPGRPPGMAVLDAAGYRPAELASVSALSNPGPTSGNRGPPTNPLCRGSRQGCS